MKSFSSTNSHTLFETLLHNYYSRSKQVIYCGNIKRDAEAEAVKNIRYRFRLRLARLGAVMRRRLWRGKIYPTTVQDSL